MVEIFGSTASTDMATTGAEVAVSHDNSMGALTNSFLLTYAKTVGHVATATLIEAAMLVLGYSDFSIAEISAALTDTFADKESSKAYRDGQIAVRGVIDMVALPTADVVNASKPFNHEWRIPKGGIPFNKGDGPALYVFNHLGINSNGPTVNSVTRWMGAWLNG